MVMVVQFGKYIKIDEVIQSNMLCKGQKMDMLSKTHCVSGRKDSSQRKNSNKYRVSGEGGGKLLDQARS